METLKIRNWEKWQSYRRDRGQPPWIKVHRPLMRNLDWVSLTDAQRGQLVSLWLLAADKDGQLPSSPEILKKLCFMSSEPDLKVFIDKGFIEWRQDGVNVASTWRQDDAPETETETETETKTETDNPSPEPPIGSSKKVSDAFKDDSEQIRLSRLLFNYIRERDPKARKPDFQKWGLHIDRLVRLDDRDPEQIEGVIHYCQNNSFWMSNILSTEKLRKQFGRLVQKMNATQSQDNLFGTVHAATRETPEEELDALLGVNNDN